MANQMGNATQADILELYLNGKPITGIADNAASAPLTNLHLRLHTAAVGNGGNQSTNETTYTGYTSMPITRNAGTPGWTVTGASPTSASPNSAIAFPAPTAGTGTITHFSLGTDATGTGKVLFWGTITPNITIIVGSPPTLTTTSVITMD